MSALQDLQLKWPRVLASIRKVQGGLSQLTPAMIRECKLDAEQEVRKQGLPGQIIKKRFDREATSGSRWAALKPSTIAARIRKGFGRGPKLVNTGALERDAIAAANDSFTIDLRRRLKPDDIGLEYAVFVNNGTPRMPARPFFAPYDSDELAILMDAASKAFRSAALRRMRLA